MVTLEICAQSLTAAINADESGAHRIELCTHLPVGGLTPPAELIKQVIESVNIPVFVLIRPRAGDFYFTPSELERIYVEIEMAIACGAAGIVSGALTVRNKINSVALHHMVSLCDGKPFTFHRAIEQVDNPKEALDQLIQSGAHRVLTGGSMGHAYQSRQELKTFQTHAGDRLTILAGSGVTALNVIGLIHESGIREVHASAKYGSSATQYQDPNDSNPAEIKKILASIASI